jgi:hypothetical protein
MSTSVEREVWDAAARALADELAPQLPAHVRDDLAPGLHAFALQQLHAVAEKMVDKVRDLGVTVIGLREVGLFLDVLPKALAPHITLVPEDQLRELGEADAPRDTPTTLLH